MPAGQPTKYDPRYCDEILTFFDREPFEVTVTEDGKVTKTACKLPTLNAFAHSLGLHRDTLHEWTQKHPEFSDAVKRAKALQEDILMQNGLFGGYDKTFAIFTAKNVAGWRDKTEQEISGSGLTVQIVKLTDADHPATGE